MLSLAKKTFLFHFRKTIALDHEKQENAAVEKSSEMLVDEIMGSLNFSCYTLSPLPPSPSFAEKDNDSDSSGDDDVGDVGNDELGNDDPDYIDKDNDDDRQCVDDNLRSVINEKSENEKSECSASESSCSTPGPRRTSITNSASKTDGECSPVQKTNTLDKDNITERTSFSMSLRSKTNRKRKRVSSESQICSQMSEVDEEGGVLKMKTMAENTNAAIDERSCEERETKMTKNGPEPDLITISEADNDKTNSLTPSCSFDEGTILAASKSLIDSRLKPTEEEDPEVSACLKSILEAVELQESTTINVQTLVEDDKSFVKTNFVTGLVNNHLETVHKETASIDKDVLDCLKSIIENISRNEQAIVSDCSEVCNDIVAMNSLDKTTVSIGAGIMDVHQQTSDIPCDEAVQSEQTHKNVHNKRILKGQKKTQKSDSCFDTRKSFGKTDKGLAVSGIQKNTCSKAEGDLKEYTEDITNVVLSKQDTDKSQDSLAESHLNRSLTLSPHLSAPLSPIPDSPERSTPRTEIPSFEVLDDLPPLSPIPPSPKGLSEVVEPQDEGGSDMTPDELELKVRNVWVNTAVSNRSNTRKSVSSGYPNPEKCVEKRGRRPSFLTTSSTLFTLKLGVFDLASQTNEYLKRKLR